MSSEPIELLQAGGSVDSSGRFSLDPRLAAEKMARFRLADPRCYVLNLAASGVAAGANQLTFSGGHQQLRFEHDGLPPDRDGLALLPEALLVSPRPSPHLWELAAALHAVRALSPAEVTMHSPEGSLRLRGNQVEIGPGTGSFACQVRLGLQPKFWKRLFQTDVPEFTLLGQRCLHSPIPIETPQGQVNRPWHQPRDQEPLCWCRHDAPCVPLQHLDPRPGHFAWGWAVALRPRRIGLPRNLEIVLHGVSFWKTVETLDYEAIVYTDSLQKDLSQADIVENDLFRQLIDDLSRGQELGSPWL